jgi:ornithine cyclodeaminase/alanine dehydrogenase-like protein (mu-crystallin family)
VTDAQDVSGGPDVPGGPRWIGPETLAAFPFRAAVDALQAALVAAPFPPTPQRLHLQLDADPSPDGADPAELLVMPATADGWASTKVVSLVASNPARGLPRVAATSTLFGPPGLQPVALLDGAALTELRTAAVSALATRYGARRDATEVVIVGTGVQARAHARAMLEELPAARVRVFGRRAAAAHELVDELRTAARRAGAPEVTARLEVADTGSLADALADADVVCLCTSSPTPVVTLAQLPPGVHVNAVGAYRRDLREVAGDVVAGSAVLVELRDAALQENGDLVLAAEEGLFDAGSVRADLHELCAGLGRARASDDERVLFTSVGHAYEDLVVARAVARAVIGAGERER